MSTFGQLVAKTVKRTFDAQHAASSFTPASLTPTLPLQIAERIGEAIVEERFAPGERLKEVDLAGAFGVSRTTLREALRILESRGLVRILPQRGAQVTRLSRSELENLFEIRAVLLGLAARGAARRHEANDLAILRPRLHALRAARDDAKGYGRASAEMVDCIARLSRNEQLAEMLAEFAQRVGRYARLGLATRERRTQSFANWRSLMDAIAAGDEQAAEDISRRLALENRDAALVAIARRAASARAPVATRAPRRQSRSA
jgi:DNA-binding GntR family transcriptional regulator